MLHIGEQIGPYTLISKIGKGAYGVVWLAERRTNLSTTKVAIKIPLDDDVDLSEVRQEADLWSKASGHANILPIIEANVYDDQVVIVSEYAPDGSLAEWMKKQTNIRAESAADMILGILSGMEYLHARNIIHRDLKPDNVLLQGETPRLADFGISRIFKSTSQSSIVAGTPAYMAPEAFDGKRSVQTDIWAVGILFYQLLSRRLPFPQSDMTSLVGAILTHKPASLPSTVPQPLQAVVMRALEKSSERRYQSAFEMRSDLKKALNITSSSSSFDSEITHVRPRPHQSENKDRSTSPLVYIVIASLVLLLLGFIGAAWFKSREDAIRKDTQAMLDQERHEREATERNRKLAEQKTKAVVPQAAKENANREVIERSGENVQQNSGWFVIGFGDHNQPRAIKESTHQKTRGLENQVLYSSDWSNLSLGWYIVVYGSYETQSQANSKKESLNALGVKAYIKHSGIRVQ